MATLVPVDAEGREIATAQHHNAGPTILSILDRMASAGVTVEAVERVAALYEREQANIARRAFFAAMAAFQAECPVIKRESKASFSTKSGGSASYEYAELDTINVTIRPFCARAGLSYTWDTTVDANAMLTCVCKVRHVDGHMETAQFTTPIEGTTLMSSAQKAAAATTIAMRQSLRQALGLITGDKDTDAAGFQGAQPTITESQAADLDTYIENVGANRAKFLEHFGIERIGDLPASQYRHATDMLAQRAKRGTT